MIDEICQYLTEKGINVKQNEPMKKHTTFRIGGPALIYVEIENIEQLKDTLRIAREKNINVTILGNGSNVLVSDEGINGIVIKINIKCFEVENKKSENTCIVKVGAGNQLGEVAYNLLKEGIAGFEEISGIPGTIGGAIKMNAGAHGKEIKDIIEKVTLMDYDGNVKEYSNEEMNFEYRSSILSKEKMIICSAIFKLEKGNSSEIKNKMDEYMNWRKEHQPLNYPNAGSTFKRGEDFITAKLIDEAGLKGYRIGGAQISEKHAGFIVNTGDATANDVIELIQYTKNQVYKKFGKQIDLEIEIVK